MVHLAQEQDNFYEIILIIIKENASDICSSLFEMQ